MFPSVVIVGLKIFIEWLIYRYVGINASDINVTAGRYGHQSKIKPPFDIGFEVRY